MLMKSLLCLLILAVAGLTPAWAQTKLAVVNSREILTKCAAWAKLVTEIQARFATRRQEVADLDQKVRKLQEEAGAPDAKPAKKKAATSRN